MDDVNQQIIIPFTSDVFFKFILSKDDSNSESLYK